MEIAEAKVKSFTHCGHTKQQSGMTRRSLNSSLKLDLLLGELSPCIIETTLPLQHKASGIGMAS